MTEMQGSSSPRELSEAELDSIHGGMQMQAVEECQVY